MASPPGLDGRVWDVLRQLLLDGSIPSYLATKFGKLHEVSPSCWAEFGESVLRETHWVRRDGALELELSGRIVIPAEHAAALIKLVSAHRDQCRTQPHEVGGAPPKYDGEAFLIEAFRLLYEGKPSPSTPAELRKRALDAYGEAGHAGGVPSEDWARTKIKKLWQRLGLGVARGNS
jgi:hypothetical protein